MFMCSVTLSLVECGCFFLNDTATTEIYTYGHTFPYTTLFRSRVRGTVGAVVPGDPRRHPRDGGFDGGAIMDQVGRRHRLRQFRWRTDRKSTRLNSSH